MTNHVENISLRKAALIAGLGLLIMTVAAIFAEFARTTTANNINAQATLFRFGIFGYLIVIVLDVIVAWALYVFLKPVNKSLSMLAAWFRIIYATLFGVSLLNLINVLRILNNSDHTEITLLLNTFSSEWNYALIFFGIHLGLIGVLVLKSNYIPRLLGFLLIIAGLGYLIDSLGKILIPDYNLTIVLVTFFGEVLLMLWLLIKGVRIGSNIVH